MGTVELDARRTPRTGASTGQTSVDAESLLGTVAAFRRSVRRTTGSTPIFEQLTGAQGELVRLLRRRPGLSVAAAAGELQLAPNTVSTLVRQLVDRGVVCRRPDVRDRRVARLDLTPSACAETSEWRDRRIVAVDRVLRGPTAERRQQLGRAVELFEELSAALANGPGADTASVPARQR